MKNCLVQKLKSTVNVEHPQYLGALTIHVKQMVPEVIKQNTVRILAKEGTVIRTADGSSRLAITSSGFSNVPTNLSSSVTIDAHGTRILYMDSSASYDIIFEDKYNIEIFQADNNTAQERVWNINIDELPYCSILNDFYLAHNKDTEGDIKSVASLTSLTQMTLQDTKITGDVYSIKDLTNLTLLNVQSTGIYGEIKPLLDNIAAKHKERSLSLKTEKNITYNGTTMNRVNTVSFHTDGTYIVS